MKEDFKDFDVEKFIRLMFQLVDEKNNTETKVKIKKRPSANGRQSKKIN